MTKPKITCTLRPGAKGIKWLEAMHPKLVAVRFRKWPDGSTDITVEIPAIKPPTV